MQLVAVAVVALSFGLAARVFPWLWAPLLGLVAFLHSSALFYGATDYALRTGVLLWIPIALTAPRHFRPARLPMLTVWFLIAVPGSLFSYWSTGTWEDALIFCLTHTGLSLTYVLLVAFIVPGIVPIRDFINWFVVFAMVFFVLGGFAQYWRGEPIVFTSSGGQYLFESYNYLISQGRMVGIFETSSHSTAVVLNICFAFLLARRLVNERSLMLHATLVILAAAIIFCQNRANILALVATAITGLMLVEGRRAIAKASMLILVIGTVDLSMRLIGAEQISRFNDVDNIIGRLDIWRLAWANRSTILVDRVFGIGFFPEAALGGIQQYMTEYFIYFGEAQLLDWIGSLGWVVTLVLLPVLGSQVLDLLRAIRSRFSHPATLPVGWGLLMAWVAVGVSYMSSTDAKFLVPLLSCLTVMWRQESAFVVELTQKRPTASAA